MASSRILVADVDTATLQTVSWVLKEHGYEVAAAPDAATLFEEFDRRSPDLLILDLSMPDVDGFQVLERIKNDERWRDLAVLAVSSLPAEEATVPTLGLGASDFIRKPFRVRELLARIQAQLRLRAELRSTREALRYVHEELARAREDAENRRKLVDILHEVTGDLASDEIYHILSRRVARALKLSRCSVILARRGDTTGIVATAFENPGLRNVSVELDRYPEVQAALERDEAVLVEDLASSALYADVRREWEIAGTTVDVRSVIALPFTLDRQQAGVFFLRRVGSEPPLSQEDVEFADAVIKAAVASIQRAQLIETTKADNARLEVLAHTDPLTQVLNRRALTSRLTAEMERARRYDSVVTLLMIDLDHFKRINDTHGHLVGDDVLREMAVVLKNAVRSVDIVARYGGEEFVAVLPETGPEGATVFAERIREVIEAHEVRSGTSALRVTASIGVACFPAPGVESVEDLFARADGALYRSKAEGRNRVCVAGEERAAPQGPVLVAPGESRLSPIPPQVPAPAPPAEAIPSPAAPTAGSGDGDERDLVGEVLADRYRLVRTIGAGGTSTVYLAQGVSSEERNAVKVLSRALSRDEAVLRPLNREKLLGRRLAHPNVCHIIELGRTEDERVFIVMPYVDGEPLADIIRRAGQFPVERTVRLVRDVATGLHVAHQLKLVHCDLKPENVMVCPAVAGSDRSASDGARERAVVMDFGIAAERKLWSELGKTAPARHVHGTPEFMSPEQVRGKALDTRSDIYSLALMTFEMLTGRLPFDGSTANDLMLARLSSAPLPLRHVRPELDFSAELELVLLRGMARDIDERYPTAPKFADALAAAAGVRPTADERASGVIGRIMGR